jgi:hypothetical protein
MDGILSLVEGEDASNSAGAPRAIQAWTTPDRPGFSFAGRFVPANELDTTDLDVKISVAGKRDFEDWLRNTSTLIVNTEVNVQLGEFTIKKNTVQTLSRDMTANGDFIEVFAFTKKDALQCAEIKITTNRKWVRVVGIGYDLQLWVPDTRRPPLPFKKAYEDSSAQWLKDVLEPWRDRVLRDVQLFIASDYSLSAIFNWSSVSSSEVAVLYGYQENGGNSESAGGEGSAVTLKEVVAYRYPKVFHIYNVVEHGRRWYRTLVFSSNPNLALHEMKMSRQNINGNMCECSGDPKTIYQRDFTLVINRENVVAEKVSRQTYIPCRLLYGIMPTSILNQYRFWQNDDDSLTAYMPVNEGNKSVARSILQVNLKMSGSKDKTGFCNSVADAQIARIFVLDNRKADVKEREFNTVPDTSKPVMYMVNLMSVLSAHAPQYNGELDSKNGAELIDFDNEALSLHALVRMMLRLDYLANILAWSRSDPTASASTDISIDVIELPRLRLTFEKKIDGGGKVRYMCVEQSGMFLAGYRPELPFADLLDGLPRAVLLANADHEYYVLMPATAKPAFKEQPTSPPTYVLVTSLTNQKWLENTGESAYFIYPIHSSGSFLYSRSVASSLYLLVLRLMGRRYRDAFRLIESCVCDSAMTPQEQQIFEVMTFIKEDLHPDANACRLKLYFVTYGCADIMPYPHNMSQELLAYISKIKLVSSYCRLSPEEEIFLISRANIGPEHLIVTNRERLIKTSFDLSFDTVSKKSSSRMFTPEYPPLVQLGADSATFYEPVDVSLLDTDKPNVANFLKKLTFGQYSRPEKAAGAPAVAIMLKIVDDGRQPGFFYLYELLADTLQIQILPDDRPRDLGSLLLATIRDDSISGLQNVILKIMECHPTFAPTMPVFEDKRKLRLPKFAGLDIFQEHVKLAATHVQANMKDLDLSKLTIKRANPFRPPSTVRASPTLEGASDYFEGRVWLNPKVIDYTCAKRPISSSFVPPSIGNLANIFTASEVSFFVGTPLHAIDLRKYVEQKNRSGRGELTVSAASPLRVMQHPSSNSHIARTSVSRLEKDMSDFAADENAGVLPILKATAGSLQGAAIELSIRAVSELISSLERLRDKDINTTRVGIKELLDYCNGVTAGANGDVRSLGFSMIQKAGYETAMVNYIKFLITIET